MLARCISSGVGLASRRRRRPSASAFFCWRASQLRDLELLRDLPRAHADAWSGRRAARSSPRRESAPDAAAGRCSAGGRSTAPSRRRPGAGRSRSGSSTCTIAASSVGNCRGRAPQVAITATMYGAQRFIAWLDRRTIARLHDKTCRRRGPGTRPYPRRYVRNLERRADQARLRAALRGAARDAVRARRISSRLALVDGDEVLASAKVYRFDAVLDGRPLRIAGLGAVFTSPASRRRGAARELIERRARARSRRRRRCRAAVLRNRSRLLRASRLLQSSTTPIARAARDRVDALRRADDDGARRRRSRSEGHRRR